MTPDDHNLSTGEHIFKLRWQWCVTVGALNLRHKINNYFYE